MIDIIITREYIINTMNRPDYTIYDTRATMHVCPLWFCDDYSTYKPYDRITLTVASCASIKVYGLRTVRVHATYDKRTLVDINLVVANVPIIHHVAITWR